MITKQDRTKIAQPSAKKGRSHPPERPEKKGTVRGFFIVNNDKGLHTRPSTELVKCATNFKAQVNLIYQDLVVNAKSLLGILTLAATRGSRITIEAVGDDAQQAIDTILQLAQDKFYIQY